MVRLAYAAFKQRVTFREGPMLEQPLKFFVVFFVVVEPISLIPLFSGLTQGATREYRRRMAVKAVWVAALILVLFALAGAPFLAVMGISLGAFRIFGGALLFLLALEMVFARESGSRTSSDERAESRRRADISVFPVAFPFIAGPGALATVLLCGAALDKRQSAPQAHPLAPTPGPVLITLDDAIQMALQHNPPLLAARTQIEQSQAEETTEIGRAS